MSSLTYTACYAIRRVNPFLGVLQVIDSPDGRASTANGPTWDIEVIADMSDTWGSLGKSNPETGLVHRPLAVQSEESELGRQCNRLIDGIQANLDKLPFPLDDNKELWLLDAERQQPLALLATLTPDARPPRPEPRYWSGCLGQNGVASQLRFPESNELREQVKRRAGFNISKRWFVRDTQAGVYTDETGQALPLTVFPPFLIREDWQDDLEKQWVRHYIHWISPALLTLQQLSDASRQRLETHLTEQAISVEHHWRLYPRVLDQQNLNSCRVQAQLQKSVQSNYNR